MGFGRNERGNVAIMVALLMSVLVMLAGVAIDVGRAVYARSQLQMEIDGAVKAAAADTTTLTEDGAVEPQALYDAGTRFFSANFVDSPALIDRSHVLTFHMIDAHASTVTATLDARVVTAFMRIWGKPYIDLHLEAAAERALPIPAELVIAWDASTSMMETLDGQRKIDTAMTAARDLVNAVMSSPQAKVGLVRFSGMLNVGRNYPDTSWIDVPATEVNGNVCALVGSDCTTTHNGQCTQDGVVRNNCSTRICRVWVPLCSDQVISWAGCVGMRHGLESSIANPTSPRYPGLLTGNCETTLLDLSNDRTAVLQRLRSTAAGDTYLPGGLLWAWNILNPAAPFTSALSNEAIAGLGGFKAIVFMTDGENTLYDRPDGRLHPIDTTEQKSASDRQTRDLCNNIKAEGITIYTVAFDLDRADTVQMLRDCASGRSRAYVADTTAELIAAFSRIASEFQSVRLVR